jgi:Mn2+/Fe2+ NRAMP family transporter
MKRALQVALGILTAIGGFVDAGAIATAVGAGAVFGLSLVWAMLLGTVAVILLVEMSGRLAAVSGKPYAASIRERFGFKYYLAPLTSELTANSLLLAADLGGMSIGLSLLTGIRWLYLIPAAAFIVWLMVWRAPFGLIENGPSLLGLVTLSFIVAIVVLGGPPSDLLTTLWKPSFPRTELSEYLFLSAAILGAVISPYLLFFYSSGAREEKWSRRDLSLNRITAVLGMGFGSITAVSLIVLSAMVLQPRDISGITLSEVGLSMAEALGSIGARLYAVALFTTCLGAALEISLSTGYNIAQGFGWEWGEKRTPAETPRFSLVISLYLLVGLGIALIGVDPLQLALYGSAFTALILPISLFPFLVLMNDREYLRDKVNKPWNNIAVIAVLAIAFLVALVTLPLLILSGG